MAKKQMVIEQPLVMLETDGGIAVHIHRSKAGELARALRAVGLRPRPGLTVDEAGAWKWVDKQRRNPTSHVTSVL